MKEKVAYRIEGGFPLCGTVRAQGSKNAALPVLFAALLIREPIRLRDIPDIGDVRAALTLLSKMGVVVRKEKNMLVLSAEEVTLPPPDAPEISSMRASSYLLGAGLARLGEMCMTFPGGCNLGVRPLDLHKKVFCLLGAEWKEDESFLSVRAKRLAGCALMLPFPSVGVTVNAVLCALACEGITEIYGYAAEPHIFCLLRFLKKAGAEIFADAKKITVHGGVPLHGCSFSVDPDEIESGTYLIGAAVCGGEISVEGIGKEPLLPLLCAFDRMGIAYRAEEARILLCQKRTVRGTDIICAPYPAFPTDLHPLFAVLLAKTHTGGRITDTVWRDRFAYVGELYKMGISAQRSENMLCVAPSRLTAACVRATDLRGGAAMMLSALAAEGESFIENTELIERGYENFAEKWRALGARVSTSESAPS